MHSGITTRRNQLLAATCAVCWQHGPRCPAGGKSQRDAVDDQQVLRLFRARLQVHPENRRPRLPQFGSMDDCQRQNDPEGQHKDDDTHGGATTENKLCARVKCCTLCYP